MANFSNASGNSMKGVELIAVIRPGRVIPQKDKEGNPTDKVGAQFVDVMVDNSTLTAADIKAGKGQSNPNLYSRAVEYTDKATGETKKGFDNGIRFSEKQVEAMKAAGEGKTLTKEDGTMYVPFKADLMYLKETVRDDAGNPVKNDKGETKKRNVGYLPNTDTLAPSELGAITQERLDKHFENTKAAKAADKTVEATAEKAVEAETKKPAKKAPKKAASKATKLATVAADAPASSVEQGMEKDPDMPFG